MKLSELWDQYQRYTKDVTDYSRKLAFAVAAICWFFKSDSVTFPVNILLSLCFVILFFLFDLLQSTFSALVYRIWIRSKEKQIWASKKTLSADEEIPKAAWLDYPAFSFFTLKIIALVVSFLFLAFEFLQRI